MKEFQSIEGNKVFIVEYDTHRSLEEIDECVEETVMSIFDYLETKYTVTPSLKRKTYDTRLTEDGKEETIPKKKKLSTAMTLQPMTRECWECNLTLCGREINQYEEKVLCGCCLDEYYSV